MPSLNVITTTCGPRRAGKLGLIFGILMVTAGGLLVAYGGIKRILYEVGLLSKETESIDDILTPATWALMWLFLILGSSMIFLGISLINSHNRPFGRIRLKIIDFILFPILLMLSPIIFIIIKLLGVFKPKSQLLKHQSTLGSRAEALLESGPQLGIQIYIVLFTMSSNWTQSFSIFTSALSISISNIEQYVTARSEEFGPMSIIKNMWVFLPATFFKILSVSMIFFLLDLKGLAVILVFCFIYAVGMTFLNICTKWRRKEKDWRYQEWDCWVLSFLTLTNLGNTKAAALQRLFSLLYWITVYTSTFALVLYIKAIQYDYKYSRDLTQGAQEVFTDNDNDSQDCQRIVQLTNPSLRDLYFMIILGLTISLGWLSLVVDVITAIIKFRHCRPIIKDYDPENKKIGFWDGFVLLEGLKYFPHCSTISNMRKIQSHL